MRNTFEAAMVMLGKTFLASKKTYINPGWESIRDRLLEYHGKTIHRSRVFEILKIASDGRIFLRKKRYFRRGTGLRTQLPGLLFLTLDFCYYLKKMGFDGWKILRDRVLFYLNTKDKRYPPAAKNEISTTHTTPQIDNTKPPDKIPKRLKDLAKQLFKRL